MGGADAVEALVAALKDESRLVRFDAVVALGRIKDSRALVPLTGLLRNGVEDTDRVAAAMALGLLGDKQAAQPLIAALGDRDDDVRSQAADALGQLRIAEAVPHLTELIKEEDIRQPRTQRSHLQSPGADRHAGGRAPVRNRTGRHI